SRDQFVRWATVRGVTARGALTEKAVAEMWRLQQGVAGIRPHADALVAEGVLERVAVEGGGPAGLIPAGSEPGEAASPVLLAPCGRPWSAPPSGSPAASGPRRSRCPCCSGRRGTCYPDPAREPIRLRQAAVINSRMRPRRT